MKIKSKIYRVRGKAYPEQSARQELRAYRRARGGPGLTTGKDPQPRTA